MKYAHGSLFAILLIAVIFISGCVSSEDTQSTSETQKLAELKSDAQNLNALISSYNGITSDLKSAEFAQSNETEATYFRSAIDKVISLNDRTLESNIDRIITKSDGRNWQPSLEEEYWTAYRDTSDKIKDRCSSLSFKITQDKYPENIIQSNNMFIAKYQKLVSMKDDVFSNIPLSESEILKQSYMDSLLNKSKEFGDLTLIDITNRLVANFIDRQRHDKGIFSFTISEMHEFYLYVFSPKVNGCQNLIDTIINS